MIDTKEIIEEIIGQTFFKLQNKVLQFKGVH